MLSKKERIVIVGTATCFLVAVFCFGYLPRDTFALGIRVGNENIGGLSKSEAIKKLEREISLFLKEKINFIFSAKIIEATPQKIGMNFYIEESLEEPFKIGKIDKSQGLTFKTFFQGLKEKIFALQGKYNFPLKVEIDEKVFNKFLTENFGEYEILPQNAKVVFNERKIDFEIEEPKDGMLFEEEKIKEELKKEGQNLKLNDVFLVLKSAPPEIGQKEAYVAQEKAKEILKEAPYLIKIKNRVFVIDKITLGNWFSFLPKKGNYGLQNCRVILEVSLDENLVENYLAEISSYVNIEAKNPLLKFENGNLKIVSPSKTGKILNIKEARNTVQEKILKGETKIVLSLEKAEPKITEEKIEELEIETLIGEGTSNFAGSPKNRVHNIKISSSKFNGVLIGPGEEFSFNKILGEVGPAQGYLPELVIIKKETRPEYGGGICQVSTTMFRAAVNSGMEILERESHAYPVRYYSWPYGQGFDATVYLPSPDLRFKNNTSGHILIQSKIKGNYLTFEFYGKDEKRKVIIKGPYQYDIKSDGSMKARLYQEVWQGGKIILKKTFLSFYKSPKLYPIKRNPLE